MHKLTMRLQIILIGLSVIFLNGCALFSYDEPDELYLIEYSNFSKKDITLVLRNVTAEISESYTIKPGNIGGSNNGLPLGSNPTKGYLDDLDRSNVKIELYTEDEQLVKEWIGPPDNFGDSINSPFNYDSWKFESLTPDAKNVVGKVTFTITDEDLD